VLCAAASLASLAACIATAPHGLERETDTSDAGGGFVVYVDGGPEDSGTVLLDSGTSDPHAVIGCDPSHGPFTGGQRVLVRGRGFSSQARVWFGATEIDPSGVVSIDPTDLQVAAPPGTAGAVDVSVQNGDDASTKRTLAGGYAYDAIYAVPSTGPIGGGTSVVIHGQGTHFDVTTQVFIDQTACGHVVVASPTELSCISPAGAPGSKPVRVTTGTETIAVLDAFLYQDSANGYEGGLSGATLAGHMQVLVYDNYTGDPIEGAYAIVGAPLSSAVVAQADVNGIATLDDPRLAPPVTLTIAASCHSPQTFASVGVDTATIYLDPQFTPECDASGDPPPIGGKSGPTGTITGELAWPLTLELKMNPWGNVPAPIGPDERRIAYVVPTAYDPTYPFARPSDSYAVTEDVVDSVFSITTSTGSHAFYAVAGIENTATNAFTAYVMGVVRGVPVQSSQTTSSVYIKMDRTLDQVVTLDVSGATPGPRGPDRLDVNVAVQLQSDGFIVLPASSQSPLLPFTGSLEFVGLPALDGVLAGSTYVTVARAVTGPSATAPESILADLITTSASTPVPVSGFVGVPTLTAPLAGATWDGQSVSATFAAGTPPDVTVYDAVVGNGVAHWLIASPGGVGSVALPDLTQLPSVALPSGPLTISVIGGRVDGLDWDTLEYHQLRTYGMTAYSEDFFLAHE
jgi:hypothetical protein